MPPFDLLDIARCFDHPKAEALALVGSYARGDAGPHSDVDLIRLVADERAELGGAGTHLIDGWLVVLSDVDTQQREEWFTRPEVAVQVIGGLRAAVPLIDRNGVFDAVQQRARDFVWDQAMQACADVWASEQMVGWIEEAHKGLAGLRDDDIGRLLNARFGLSWGLSRVVTVRSGILLAGNNTFWSQVEAVMGHQSEWARLRRKAFGIEGHSLRDQVIAGLRLYVLTADMLQAVLVPEHAVLLSLTVQRIERTLADLRLDGPEVARFT